jgi:uncharacterized protein
LSTHSDIALPNVDLIIVYLYHVDLMDVMSNNKGQASTDEETKRRVSKAGGEARAQDKEGLREAGRKGGQKGAETVKKEYGDEFYSKLAKKGGEKRAEDKEGLREAGRKGGES